MNTVNQKSNGQTPTSTPISVSNSKQVWYYAYFENLEKERYLATASTPLQEKRTPLRNQLSHILKSLA